MRVPSSRLPGRVLPLVVWHLALLALQPRSAREQSSSSKAAVDSVRIDVEVRRGGRQLLGLTAADFGDSVETTVCGSAPN